MTLEEWNEDCETYYPILYNKWLKWTVRIDAAFCFPIPCINLYDCYLRGETHEGCYIIHFDR